MKSEDILALFDSFEKAATQINGIECWSARSLCQLLGYTDWRNFLNAIEKAKESCINAGEQESDHFVGANKMVFCFSISNVFTKAPTNEVFPVPA